MEILKTYHFVSTNGMKEKINKLAYDKNLTVSKTIIYIINLMLPFLEYHHLIYKESTDYTYTQFDAETEIKFRIYKIYTVN